MIFLGDIAHPFEQSPDFSSLCNLVEGQPTVINLEGALSAGRERCGDHVLFNHESVIEALQSINTSVAVLANNHIGDLPQGIEHTRTRLAEVGIQSVGAGRDLAEAAKPAAIVEDGSETLIIAFGWETIQCKPATKKRSGVSPLCIEHILSEINNLRRARPSCSIVAVFHWNYELEPHPQPAHRRLAFAAIDAGADAIVAHHPHCVGGFEFYKGKLIAHSLGNWWLPQGVFFGGKLSFPDYTLPQVALEWHPLRGSKLHWFEYNRCNHSISFIRSDPLNNENTCAAVAPYAGYSSREYLSWFRRHRMKRKALPIYKNPESRFENWIFDQFVKLRHPLIMAIKRVKAN